jgi:uracil DNA glycosylase
MVSWQRLLVQGINAELAGLLLAGLAFSVRSNVAVPPSLRNIYKEIKNDYPEFVVPKHGYVSSYLGSTT